MIPSYRIKSKNKFLNILCVIVNFIIMLGIGIANLLIAMGIGFYKKITKKYKYEFLYIFIISLLCILLSVLSLIGIQNDQYVTFIGKMPKAIFVICIVLFSLIGIFGFVFYILTIFKHKKIPEKYFWYIRAISYAVTFLFVVFLIDYVILDFISRYQTVKKPTAENDLSTYDTMIFFLRVYNSSFKEGIKVTLLLSLIGTVLGLILALGMVALRMMKPGPRDTDFVKFWKKLGNSIANVYVTVIRGTPMVVQAFVFYYLVVGIAFAHYGDTAQYQDFLTNVWTPFRAGLFTVTINTTAYITEILRGGINSVDIGQSEAAQAIGFGKFRTMMLIVFPQAIKNSLPAIGNEFIVNIKDTSVLVMIGILDLFSVAKMDILGKYSGKSLEAYLLVAIIYLILTFFTAKLLNYIEKKMNMTTKPIPSSN